MNRKKRVLMTERQYRQFRRFLRERSGHPFRSSPNGLFEWRYTNAYVTDVDKKTRVVYEVASWLEIRNYEGEVEKFKLFWEVTNGKIESLDSCTNYNEVASSIADFCEASKSDVYDGLEKAMLISLNIINVNIDMRDKDDYEMDSHNEFIRMVNDYGSGEHYKPSRNSRRRR